jgi:hypothetical protein
MVANGITPRNKPFARRVRSGQFSPLSSYHKRQQLVSQTVCLPVSPRCDICDLSSKALCPSARIPKGAKSKSRKNLSDPKVEIVFDGTLNSSRGAIDNALELPSLDVATTKAE